MKNIQNEEPDIHWGFLNVQDKIVLDLGCAKFFSQIATAEYFVKSGAKKVIGVDLSDIGYADEKFLMKVERIESSSQLNVLIYLYRPEIIKCDIEGAEIYFEGVEMPSFVKEFAVEYHDEKTKASIENSIKSWDFPNIEYYTLLGHSIDRIGVIHVWK